MAIGQFMPMIVSPASSKILTGYITVGSYVSQYGWSDGVYAPAMGSVAGSAAAYLMHAFYWQSSFGAEALGTPTAAGATLTFKGVSVVSKSMGGDIIFEFTPAQIVGWPTSGTHEFTLELA